MKVKVILTVVTLTRKSLPATVVGQPCHGANIFNGEQIASFEGLVDVLGGATSFPYLFWSNFALTEIGVLNPGGTDAALIDATTPLDAVMATKFDVGGPGGAFADLDPEIQARYNVPIHQAHQIADFSGNREQVVGTNTNNPSKLVVQSNSNTPVTLEQWNSVQGEIKFNCFSDGTGDAYVEAKNLIPNGIYTVWALFAVTNPPADFVPQFPAANFGVDLPVAFQGLGGAPMTIVADNNGKAEWFRDLNFCPLELENPLMYNALLYHWDNSLYGAMPQTPFLAETATGLVASDHLYFNTGEALLDVVWYN